MDGAKKKKEFFMKYCPALEDQVVVMTTGDRTSRNKVCLSSHLCQTDTRMSCGHERSMEEKKNGQTIF